MVSKALLQHLPQSCPGVLGQGALLAFALVPSKHLLWPPAHFRVTITTS